MPRKLDLLLALALTLSLLLAACGGDGESPAPQPGETPGSAGDSTRGKEVYIESCAGCHGPNGEGLEGLGKPLIGRKFVQNSTDDELATLVKLGRPTWDPANTTGVDMPPKGGNPALSNDDLLDIIAFLRAGQAIPDVIGGGEELEAPEPASPLIIAAVIAAVVVAIFAGAVVMTAGVLWVSSKRVGA